jgi:hypothetical protein
MIRSVFLLLGAAMALSAADFPVKPSKTSRYLVDARNQSFLYHADTAWMLFLKLTADEAGEYLRARQEQGFNTIQVQLTGFLGMTNRAGELPFNSAHDFAHPNEKYFSHVDAVLEKARELNLLVAIAPLWSGCCGEGWAGKEKDGKAKPLNANGVEKAAEFGRWLGQRYGKYQNITWILGGDMDPHNAREEIRALALALKQTAPHQWLTYHASSSHSSTDVWPGETWIDVPMVYTYFRGFNKAWNKNQPDVYEVSWKEYNKSPTRPFFLGESTYEGEHDDWGSPLQARKQACWALLSGAAGHAYGSPNWNFPNDWRAQIKRPGAESLKHVRAFFESIRWTKLVPDQHNKFAVKGNGEIAKNDLAVSAVANDRTFAVTYFPGKRSITFDLTQLSPDELRVIWFNPRTGQRTLEGRMGKTSAMPLQPASEGDWLLLFE